MQRLGFAALVVLLATSAANGTVYVWQDGDGALVMTNVESQLRDAPDGSVRTYATTETASADEASAAGGDTARGEEASEMPAPVAVTRAPRAAAVAPVNRQAQEPATPAGPTASAPVAATLGEASAQHLVSAATTPTDRAAIDPRSLLDLAARQEPPQVFVSIVSPSAGALSTSDGATSLGGRRARGAMSGGDDTLGASGNGFGGSAMGNGVRGSGLGAAVGAFGR